MSFSRNLKNAASTRTLVASALVTSICTISLIYRGFVGDASSSSILDNHFGRHASSTIHAEDYTSLPPHVSDLFSSVGAAEGMDYHDWNAQTQRELYACIAMKNCGKNQQKIALLAAHWFEEAIVRNWRGGEGVWALSIYKNLRLMGYTTFFANSFEEALEQYREFPDLVKVVIRNKAGECHEDPHCVKGPSNPRGIPAWKIFDFEFFPSVGGHLNATPMGGKWILSANPDPRFIAEEDSPLQYIGYSIEDDCHKTPVVRLSHRSNQVWMLMKQIKYVYDDRFTWNRSYFTTAAQELQMNFVGGWMLDQNYLEWDPKTQGDMPDIADPGHGVINFGPQSAKDFMTQVGLSKAMIGVGNPFWSPSPYNALCQGVPFINPIINWNRDDPWNKAHWHTQHPSLNQFERPYVYHVHARDWDFFLKAVEIASTTEIPRFIPRHMTEVAVQERLTRLMESDWRALASSLLGERLQEAANGKQAYTFEL